MTRRVAYLGPEGSFTHETALQWIQSRPGDEYVLLPCRSVDEVVSAVASTVAERGVVPVATSSGGPIVEYVAAVERAPVKVVDSLSRVCRYMLLALRGASLDQIREIRSHPKAFADCRTTLGALLPNANLVETASTGAAVESVAADERPDLAAVAPLAATSYGLSVLARDLQDDPDNRTTWAVIAKA